MKGMVLLGAMFLMASCIGVKHNTLTEAEKADGWQLLFDGQTLDGWKDYNGETLTQPWHVVDGCIQANGDGSDLSGYIVTKKQYDNFILDWDWKLSYGGNSGMLYHVVEDPYFKVPYVTGPEYQLIDNEGWETTNAPTKLRVKAHIVGHVTAFDISTTELKSPGLDTGKPASITSTPNSSRAFATSIFSTVLSWQPGTCSPSRNVVSKMNNLSLIYFIFFFKLKITFPLFRRKVMEVPLFLVNPSDFSLLVFSDCKSTTFI